jgi:catechol 2,3-dioxygenase-like lactoylglutathione lyase family enzyme
VRPSVSLVTLGVADYGRAKAFYEALGWSLTWEAEETAFFQANGVVLVLWSREKLASDMGYRRRDGRLGRHRARPQRGVAR